MTDSLQTAPTNDSHARELAAGERFSFGENWTRFLSVLDEDRIRAAETGLQRMLGQERLNGLSLLDVGSGSGLSSLAAWRLGARVHSFDYDPQSVACTQELRRRYAAGRDGWTVERGSALDAAYLGSLGSFDIVYSWGVLHHTGNMWQALENVGVIVAPGARLFIALYNDQGAWSRRWRAIKRLYCSGTPGRVLVCGVYIPTIVVRSFMADLVWRRNPLKRYSEYRQRRGMSVVHDWFDWLGGYPFEVAKPEEIFGYFRDRGFALEKLSTSGGSVGCNEFVFRRTKPTDADVMGAPRS